MPKFTEMWDKVLKEKLVAKTNVGNTTLGFDDKGTLSANGKIGGLDVSANSKGHAQATGKVAGGTMPTAVNKDGDGGYAYSKGPNQISKRVPLNNSKEVDEVNEASFVTSTQRAPGVSPDYGFYTVEKGGKYELRFNDGKDDESLGIYDTYAELQQAQEYAKKEMRKHLRDRGVSMQKPMDYNITQDKNGNYVAKVNDSNVGEYVIGTYKSEKEAKWAIDIHNKTYDKEERMDATGHEQVDELEEADDLKYDFDRDNTMHLKEWEIVINGNTYTTSRGETEDEAINNFWKAVVEKEGIKKFLGDMVFAQAVVSNEETVVESDEELSDILRIAGLK